MVPALTATAESSWPQWRGPLSTGAAPDADPPLTWSESQNVKWKTAIPGEGDATPIISGNDAILSCFDARNGAAFFEHERLEAIHSVYASPVSAKDRVYVLSREGVCVVLKKGPKPEVLAVNKLADYRNAWVTIDGKQILSEQWVKMARTPTGPNPGYGYMNWILNAPTDGSGRCARLARGGGPPQSALSRGKKFLTP